MGKLYFGILREEIIYLYKRNRIESTFLWCQIFLSCQIYIYIYVRGKNGDVFRLKRWKKVCGRKEVFHDFVCSCCHMQYWSSWLVNWTGRWEQRVKRFPFWSWVTLYVPTQTVLYCSTRIEPAYSVCLTFRAHTPNTLIDRI